MRAPLAVIAVLALSVLSQPGRADPDAILNALSKQSPSLLDLSLARLEAYLRADGLAGGYQAFPYAQDGMVRVYVWSPEHPGSEETCRALADRLRELAGVSPQTGEPMLPSSLFASFFSYSTFDGYAVDETYDETVDAMIELYVVTGVGGNDEAVICKGPLLSNEVTVTRE